MDAMDVLTALEGMGYEFTANEDKLHFSFQNGEPPFSVSELVMLLKPHKNAILRVLQDRAAGFSRVPDGVLFAFGADIPPLARKIKAAMDNGELWDVRVIYSKSADRAEFRFLPPEWGEQ